MSNLDSPPADFPGIVPRMGDNAAIARRRIDPGEVVSLDGVKAVVQQTILEGHRFATRRIQAGERITSWGLPFGKALCEIPAGAYLCNAKMLEALRSRDVPFTLPANPNFIDHRIAERFDEASFRPGTQVAPLTDKAFFNGFAREGSRGVGTRNVVVVLGTSSRAANLARQVEARFKGITLAGDFDGVVAVAHTEGGGLSKPNNFELTLRTLAGFLINPNLAAFVALDYGTEPITNSALESFMTASGYPLQLIPHAWITAGNGSGPAVDQAVAWINGILPSVSALKRSRQSACHLRIGLQCGGSDAFSGVSGNPLIGWMARESVRNGGAANLAETDELIGAEPYILSNVKDLTTAKAFLGKLDRFQEWAAWHGENAEANPSGGNIYRGLYNIVIKSIGAAMKKSPDVRLDHVIDYGVPMRDPGFYFMDSPGNDLESIAGQVASGCNMILFATGNGSITNFPYVPTLKVMTTTNRFNLLSKEMDINAGRFQDGEDLETLGTAAFSQMLRVASGEKSAGEKAGHSQVQLWREWSQKGPSGQGTIPVSRKRDGIPLIAAQTSGAKPLNPPPVGLIVPTSLCAGQIGLMISRRLNQVNPGLRHVALAHTEGCGNSSGEAERLLLQCLCGYLRHPSVSRALLLEHGCEKTHNDALRHALVAEGLDPSKFGWASVQMDGGIEKVGAKVEQWFRSAPATPFREGPMILGLEAAPKAGEAVCGALGRMASGLLKGGASVVVAETSPLWQSAAFKQWLSLPKDRPVTVDFGQPIEVHGLHCMHSPSTHLLENTTALAACGSTVILAVEFDYAVGGNPVAAVGQAAVGQGFAWEKDLDLLLAPSDQSIWPDQLTSLAVALHEGRIIPKSWLRGAGEIQLTRGLSGISL